MDFLAVSTTSYYFIEVNFSISLPFPEKKEGRKEKPWKTITTALQKKKQKHTRLFWPAFSKTLNPKI